MLGTLAMRANSQSELTAEIVSALLAEALAPLHESMRAMSRTLDAAMLSADVCCCVPRAAAEPKPAPSKPRAVPKLALDRLASSSRTTDDSAEMPTSLAPRGGTLRPVPSDPATTPRSAFPEPAMTGRSELSTSSRAGSLEESRVAVATPPRPSTPVVEEFKSSPNKEHDMGTMAAITARRTTYFESVVRSRLSILSEGRRVSRFFTETAVKLVEWLERLQEPPREGYLYCITSSYLFTSLVSLVILFSAGVAAYSAEWEMQNLGRQPPRMLSAFDLFMLCFFATEILMRLAVHRLYFFVNASMNWNLFDFIVVSISISDAILAATAESNHGGNMGYIRMMRFLKLAKVLRVFRLMKVFRALSVMLETFQRSVMSLFWCFVMLLFLLFMFALVFLNGVSAYLEIERAELTQSEFDEYLQQFGSIAKSCLTLFMVIYGGGDAVQTFWLLVPVGSFYAFAYLGYVFFSVFAVTNILTGVFVERAVEAAMPDREEKVLAKRREMIMEASEFRNICSTLDVENKGTLSLDAFKQGMRNPTMVAHLASVGLAVHDVELFFRVVAGKMSATEIDIDMFVEGCMTMRGQATALDIKQQLFNMQALLAYVKKFERACNEKMDRIMHVSERVLLATSEAYASSLP